MTGPLVIVGASYAGLQIAVSARQAGFAERVLLVGAERHLPYQRPPLSKAFLLDKVALSALPLRPESFYAANGIELRLATRVAAIDRMARTVRTEAGEILPYGALALATGSEPRRLAVPGADLDGVLYLRDLDDALALRERIDGARSVVVVGGGYVGLEVAASLAAAGREVTVIEAAERLLARVATPVLSAYLQARHERAGVRILLGRTAARLSGEAGRVTAVECGDGTLLPADVVLVGIGATARTALAAGAGLPCGNGIAVDEFGCSPDPAIYAAGDCTWHFSPVLGQHVRLESVQNAQDQAKVVGANVAGAAVTYRSVPWFWSDQYDLKLQMAGTAAGCDRSVLRGRLEDGRFSLFHYRADTLVGVDSVNRPADHVAARKLLAAGVHPGPDQAQNESFDLRNLEASPA